MMGEKDFDDYNGHAGSIFNDAGFGALRIVLLFGSAAVALTLILLPIIQGVSGTGNYGAGTAGIDQIDTGSLGYVKRYTIHRSILQKDPGAICIINEDGSKSGDCR